MFRLLTWLPISLFIIGFTSAQRDEVLIIFAASSLTNAFLEIETGFEQQNPGVDVLFNFAGSSTLAAQLAQGAPADIFASANPAQMTSAQEVERIADKPRTFITNRLTLIIPQDNPARIQSLADLAQPGISLIVAAPGVPARTYTDQIIERLSHQPDMANDYISAVYANIVSEERNVRQVMFKVAIGDADAGFVYTSDITPDIADSVQTLAIPDAINVVATYPIAVTSDSQQPALAGAFIHYVLSEAGQATLRQWGFSPVEAHPLLRLFRALLKSPA